MSENSAEVKSENSVETENQPQEEKPTGRGKRSAGKRVSMLARTAQEGEAILKGMGHKEDGAPEGRRTTRSSSRGSTGSQATPPPAKRERKTPSTGKGSSRRGRPKREEPEEENEEIDAENKSENKDEEKKDEKEENGKSDESEKKENSVDGADGGGDAKPMDVEESDKSTPAEGDKPTDNGPAEQPSSPAKTEEASSKPGEPENADTETKKEEDSSKPEPAEEKTESDTREAPPPQSE